MAFSPKAFKIYRYSPQHEGIVMLVLFIFRKKIISLYSSSKIVFSFLFFSLLDFDGQFVLSWLLQQETTPSVISYSSKIMAMTHKALNIRLIDSLDLLPMTSSKLPACFGITELQKGFFPHLFNTRENQDYAGSLYQESKILCLSK